MYLYYVYLHRALYLYSPYEDKYYDPGEEYFLTQTFSEEKLYTGELKNLNIQSIIRI